MTERPWKTSDPDFETRVRDSFLCQKLMTTLGAELAAIAPGEITIEMPFCDDFAQQDGFIHAGIVTAIADSACGYAAWTLLPAGDGILSVEFKVNLLAPAAGEKLIARARVVRAGRTLIVCQADVFAKNAADEKHVATMLATMIARQTGGR